MRIKISKRQNKKSFKQKTPKFSLAKIKRPTVYKYNAQICNKNKPAIRKPETFPLILQNKHHKHQQLYNIQKLFKKESRLNNSSDTQNSIFYSCNDASQHSTFVNLNALQICRNFFKTSSFTFIFKKQTQNFNFSKES
eukprot:TRINITY_DN12481_c2_g1_i1.p3 TRINITY_DN12481_c2_g1~~TRINITY_DN12481_c2_g1_i1.p3  ORF type:complete len:138 (+),score=0.34 TRINITY_DN12481_c2_g1_i1:21-434(+)